MEIPFYSTLIRMPDKGINPSVTYVGSCLSLASQDGHGGYHHSREGIGMPGSSTLRNLKIGLVFLFLLVLLILIQKPSLWHILSIILGMGIFFSVNKIIQAAYQTAERILKIPLSEQWVAILRFRMAYPGLWTFQN